MKIDHKIYGMCVGGRKKIYLSVVSLSAVLILLRINFTFKLQIL